MTSNCARDWDFLTEKEEFPSLEVSREFLDVALRVRTPLTLQSFSNPKNSWEFCCAHITPTSPFPGASSR